MLKVVIVIILIAVLCLVSYKFGKAMAMARIAMIMSDETVDSFKKDVNGFSYDEMDEQIYCAKVYTAIKEEFAK